MENMKGLVTLLFFKYGKLGYFDANFSKLYISKFKASVTSICRHNRYFSRPYNFAIFEGRSSEFGKLGYFDMFIILSVFQKYYFIC